MTDDGHADDAGRPRHLLLTGRPGVGKTTVARRAAEELAAAGLGVAGFCTEETRGEDDRRRGFRGVPLGGGGDEALIAHVEIEGPPRVSRYGVDVDAVDRLARETLEPGDGVDVVVVDEIGRMECLSEAFVERMRKLLDGPRPVLATVGSGGEGFRQEVRGRGDVELWRVTEGNRDRLPGQLAERLLHAAGGAEDAEGG